MIKQTVDAVELAVVTEANSEAADAAVQKQRYMDRWTEIYGHGVDTDTHDETDDLHSSPNAYQTPQHSPIPSAFETPSGFDTPSGLGTPSAFSTPAAFGTPSAFSTPQQTVSGSSLGGSDDEDHQSVLTDLSFELPLSTRPARAIHAARPTDRLETKKSQLQAPSVRASVAARHQQPTRMPPTTSTRRSAKVSHWRPSGRVSPPLSPYQWMPEVHTPQANHRKARRHSSCASTELSLQEAAELKKGALRKGKRKSTCY